MWGKLSGNDSGDDGKDGHDGGDCRRPALLSSTAARLDLVAMGCSHVAFQKDELLGSPPSLPWWSSAVTGSSTWRGALDMGEISQFVLTTSDAAALAAAPDCSRSSDIDPLRGLQRTP
eukprot:TRINITY_DN4541_c0_g1_i1.p5 TRINITY_DN4541_c0_g1~~TRINITY_DN4541_c0_g1_i1.p5  ORF type:complete len:118 (+),score=11.52 TRINITY_DN4541_c0_g1_i1:1094-1447(+)